MLGLPVLAGPVLHRVGTVAEVLLTQEADRVCGLVLDPGSWLQPRRVLDYGAVRAVGPTHLLAEERYLTEEGAAHCCRDLIGLPVLNAGAEELGVLDDIWFDPKSGRVHSLELSCGLVDDLLHGKPAIELTGAVTAGEAAILMDGPGEYPGGASI